MPTTVNGIGTHYYGKKNRSARSAVCRSCNRSGLLESYDTRLWFVIVFIPIIPLGRKRVMDSCPSCQRHFVADADAYEQARQLQVSAALDEYRRDPSPGAALQAHATLLGFHETEQAASFRQSACERFPEDAELRVGLAHHCEQASAFREASDLFEDAYRLDPDLPEARVAIARRKMAEGDLDGGRRLLDFLEVPGAGQNYALGPLDVLSTYYQQQGRHEEALAIAEHLLREIPDAGQQHKFRKFVGRSEKALGRFESILPPREHSLRGLFSGEGHVYSKGLRWAILGGGGALLLAAGLAINNEYIRKHRTIHVVNPLGAPVQVSVDGGPPQTIGDRGSLAVEEGHHQIRLEGPVDQTQEVDVGAGYFDRWFKKPAWVLIPDAESVLVEHTVIYAKDPQPSNHRLIYGEAFVSLPHVDYLFEDPPQSLQVKGNATVTKISLELFPGTDVQAFRAVTSTDREAGLAFAERRLLRHPADAALLKAYDDELEPNEDARGEATLEKGLSYRPVVVLWHRRYQRLAERQGHFDGLAARYDGYLKDHPKDAALLYLRARVEPDRAKQEDDIRRAMAADPGSPWPWEARAAREAEAGRWDDCLRSVAKARERKIPEDVIEDSLMTARLATGGARDLATEYRARLSANPMDFEAVRGLFEAIAASGKPAELETEMNAFLHRLPIEVQAAATPSVRMLMLFLSDKLAECEQLCQQTPPLRGSLWRLHCLLATGRASEAAKDPTLRKWTVDDRGRLLMALALALEGRRAEADTARGEAIALLSKMGPDSRRLAQMLRGNAAPKLEEVSNLDLSPRFQALACALLADRFPASRSAFLEAAARYNVRRMPPYHLIRRAIESPAPTTPTRTAKR